MKHKKLKTVLSVFFLVLLLSACKKQPAETSAEAEAEESEAEEEEEETAEEPNHTGYSHYIDPEEAAKAAESESGTQEEEPGGNMEETEIAASETAAKETENTEQTQTSVSETSQASEAAANSGSTAGPQSVLPDCALTDGEWYPPVPVFIIKDQAEVKDEPNAGSGVQGRLDYGTSIGSVGRSGGYIRVNYGVKPAWIEISAVSVEDPLK